MVFGSGRADVSGQLEKTVGLGFNQGAQFVFKTVNKNRDIYSTFVKGETTKAKEYDVQDEEYNGEDMSREERNAATFTAQVKINETINSEAKVHVSAALDEYKAKLNTHENVAKKSRWDTAGKERKSRWD